MEEITAPENVQGADAAGASGMLPAAKSSGSLASNISSVNSSASSYGSAVHSPRGWCVEFGSSLSRAAAAHVRDAASPSLIASLFDVQGENVDNGAPDGFDFDLVKYYRALCDVADGTRVVRATASIL